jgi:hypothetical protein
MRRSRSAIGVATMASTVRSSAACGGNERPNMMAREIISLPFFLSPRPLTSRYKLAKCFKAVRWPYRAAPNGTSDVGSATRYARVPSMRGIGGVAK